MRVARTLEVSSAIALAIGLTAALVGLCTAWAYSRRLEAQIARLRADEQAPSPESEGRAELDRQIIELERAISEERSRMYAPAAMQPAQFGQLVREDARRAGATIRQSRPIEGKGATTLSGVEIAVSAEAIDLLGWLRSMALRRPDWLVSYLHVTAGADAQLEAVVRVGYRTRAGDE